MTLTLGTSGTREVLTVRLSTPLVPAPPRRPGRGLLGMRERVESIGGTMTAGEEDGRFVVELTLPLDEHDVSAAAAPDANVEAEA
ncbi:hypothetical protein NKG05_13265 [Oerskovia sp. M15]